MSSEPALQSGDLTVLDNGSIPLTTITAGPADQAVISDPTPSFEFTSDDPDGTFECSFGGGAFAACESPVTLGPLSDDGYNFRVRAVGSNGAVDPSPESRTFRVERPECLGREATVVGTPGNSTTVGTPGDDVIVTEGADDVIVGLGGNDLICAGGGKDSVYAGTGNDVVRGDEGDDLLRGGGRRGLAAR